MNNELIIDFNFLFTLFYVFYKTIHYYFFIVSRVDPRVLHILSKCFTTEVYIQPSSAFIYKNT